MQNHSQFDAELLRDFYRANLRRVYDFLFFKVLDSDVAEDLTSETFLAFAERIRSGKSIESPSKFIMGIAYNKLQAYLRERYRIPRGEYDLEKISDDSDDLDEVLTEGKKITTLEEILLEFLDELPGQQKQIIKLRLIDKLSLPEICERIDKNMGYVKTTQNRAIKNLQKLVACKPVDTN